MEKIDELHVISGTGPLGLSVMKELLKRNKRIKMVNFSSSIDLPLGVDLVHADVGDSAQAANVFRDATVVYHCAQPEYTKWPEKFPQLTKGLIHGTIQAGAKLVYADNLYMYGPSNEAYTENSPNQASDRKGITRAKMAEEVLEANHSGKLRAVIGRAPDFYGPGVLHSILGGDRVFKSALQGKPAQVIGNIDVPHTHIYISDFARGLVTLALEEKANGEIWHIPSGETATTRELISQIYKELNIPCKVQNAPKFIFQLMTLFNPYMREMKEINYIYNNPYIVDHSKYEHLFGKEVTPHTVAIKETLDWFRNSVSTNK